MEEICITIPATTVRLELPNGKSVNLDITEAVRRYEELRAEHVGRTGWELLDAFTTYLKGRYPDAADAFTMDVVDRLTEKMPEAYLQIKKKSADTTKMTYESLRSGG